MIDIVKIRMDQKIFGREQQGKMEIKFTSQVTNFGGLEVQINLIIIDVKKNLQIHCSIVLFKFGLVCTNNKYCILFATPISQFTHHPHVY